MRRTSRARFTAASLMLAATFALISLPKAQAFDNPNWGANYFPNVVLTTQDGKQVKFYDDLLRNKMFAINLIYTHCTDVCPLETAKLGQVYKLLQDRMGKDLYFYSITIDPKRDTPTVLKAYSEKFHTGPGWYFLTGKKADIDAIRQKLGIALRPNSDPLTGHTTSMMIGNEATGQWILDSSMDDPHYLAAILGNWMSSWKYNKVEVTYDQKPPMDPLEHERGGSLFRTSCAACHTVGGGDLIGPDLATVTNVRDRKWLKHFIQEPDVVLKSQDPIAVALYKKYKQVNMPNLKLDDAQAENLVQFLEARAKENAHGESPENHEATTKANSSGTR
jgi:protein SCO1/2